MDISSNSLPALRGYTGSVGEALDVEALSLRYGPMVLRRCRRLLRDENEALDACQDVFVRLLANRTRLDGAYPSSLLFRIATNVCLNRIRDRKRRPETPDDERFYFVTGETPFLVAPVMDAALPIARELSQSTFSIQKEVKQ